MSRSKYSIEEKLRIVQEILAGKISANAAAKKIGADDKSVADWVRNYENEGITALCPKTRNKQYSQEEKEAAVKAYLAGEGSLTQICQRYKIRSTKQLRSWIKVYNGHKDFKRQTGGSHMTKARKTTIEERITIAKECIESGYNYGELAIKYQVSYQQVYNWVKKFTAEGEAGLEDRRGQRVVQQVPRTPEEEYKIKIAQLEHENYLLRMERDLLKKVQEIERGRD